MTKTKIENLNRTITEEWFGIVISSIRFPHAGCGKMILTISWHSITHHHWTHVLTHKRAHITTQSEKCYKDRERKKVLLPKITKTPLFFNKYNKFVYVGYTTLLLSVT